MTRVTATLGLIAGFGMGLVCAAASAQDSDPSEDGTQTPSATFDEEIIVRGRSRPQLRAEIRIAEEAFYERFNEINSDDEYDIHCRWVAVTGSRMLRRICEANFWRDAEADLAEETVRGLQGSITAGAQQFRGEQYYKRQLLIDEMRRLAAQDEELLGSLMRLANLQELLADRRLSRPPTAAVTREATAEEGVLPYDAQMMVEVRIGRAAWHHALTYRTFTIAQVNGDIRSVDVNCDERSERLEHQPGVEWTLPQSWGACTVRVDARRDTTFALYEFP